MQSKRIAMGQIPRSIERISSYYEVRTCSTHTGRKTDEQTDRE